MKIDQNVDYFSDKIEKFISQFQLFRIQDFKNEYMKTTTKKKNINKIAYYFRHNK